MHPAKLSDPLARSAKPSLSQEPSTRDVQTRRPSPPPLLQTTRNAERHTYQQCIYPSNISIRRKSDYIDNRVSGVACGMRAEGGANGDGAAALPLLLLASCSPLDMSGRPEYPSRYMHP